MTSYKIDPERTKIGLDSGTIKNPDLSNSSDLIRGTLSIASESSADDAASLVDSTTPTEYPSVENAKSYLAVASSAISSITSLRERQLELADLAQNSPQGSLTKTLNTELSTIQTEIQRVATDATYQGQNTITRAATFTTYQSDVEDIVVVAVANSSSLTADPGVSLTTQAGATSAYSSIDESLSAARSLDTGTELSLNHAEREAIIPTNDNGPAPPTDPPEASVVELSKQIAGQLGSPFSSEKQNQTLIELSTGELKSDRVRDLLSDD